MCLSVLCEKCGRRTKTIESELRPELGLIKRRRRCLKCYTVMSTVEIRVPVTSKRDSVESALARLFASQ